MEQQKKDLLYLIKDLKERGVINNIANFNVFLNLKDKDRVIYFGIDCSADGLHIGHFFQIIQLFRLSLYGFNIFILTGGSTTKIGDPSDKIKERKKIDVDLIKIYQQSIENQIKNLIYKSERKDFFKHFSFSPLSLFFNNELLEKIYVILNIKQNLSIEEKWKKFISYIVPDNLKKESFNLINNSEWLDKLSCVDFLDIVGKNVTVNYLLSKDWIKKRVEKGISYSSFSYSLLQSYDFYYLYKNYNCHGQVGGSDQWGNITTAIKMMHGASLEDMFFGFSFSLLKNSSGKKISKTEDNYLLLKTSDKRKFYDFFCNMSDEQVKDNYITGFSFLSLEQIDSLNKINVPTKLRILQRIVLELIWVVVFGEIDSLEEITINRGKKNSFYVRSKKFKNMGR